MCKTLARWSLRTVITFGLACCLRIPTTSYAQSTTPAVLGDSPDAFAQLLGSPNDNSGGGQLLYDGRIEIAWLVERGGDWQIVQLHPEIVRSRLEQA